MAVKTQNLIPVVVPMSARLTLKESPLAVTLPENDGAAASTHAEPFHRSKAI